MRTAAATLLLATLLLSASACNSTDEFVVSAGVWVSIDPVQCDGNAWDSVGMTVEAYYESLGVEVMASVTVQFADEVCLACSCPTGDRVFLEIDPGSLGFMLREGFVRNTPP